MKRPSVQGCIYSVFQAAYSDPKRIRNTTRAAQLLHSRIEVPVSLLEVHNLNVSFTTLDGVVNAVMDLSFSVDTGEALGIVGESGSGKSQTILGIMGLLARNGRAEGEILFKGRNLLDASEKEMN